MMEGDPLAPLTVPTKFSTLSEYSSCFFYFSSIRLVSNSYVSFVDSLPWCELSTEDFDTICVIYQLPQKKRSYHRLIRKNIHFITHDLMASQGNRTEVLTFYSELPRLVLIPYMFLCR